MRVLHIINSLVTGGAEKMLCEILPILNNSIVADLLLLDGGKYPFYKDIEAINCCKIMNLPNSNIYNPFFIIRIIPYLKRYDVVHVHLFPSQYFVVFAKVLSFSNVKLVFTEHSTSNRRMEKKWLRPLEKMIYYFYHKIICISNGVKSELLEKYELPASKLVVVENGINIDKINGELIGNRIAFGYSKNDIVLIMVASFKPAKDHLTVLEALAGLPERYKLLLVGDGADKNRIIDLSIKMGLRNRIQFAGIRTDVYPLLKMADIAILSSHWEGFGIAAAEAMACGTPVIASDVEGLSQVVAGGGILFEKGNSVDLVNKVLSLETDSYYCNIKQSGILKSAKYDITELVSKYLLVYRSLI